MAAKQDKRTERPALGEFRSPGSRPDPVEDSRAVGIGLVGCGGFAAQTLELLGELPAVRVLAAADLNKELADRVADRFGARAFADVRSLMVESRHVGVEAVLMSLPHHVYPEYVRLAADHGLHLLKEKPLARSFEEGRELVEAFERSGGVFMIGTQRRFHPGFAALKERLAESGRPFLVRSHFLFNWNGEFRWRGERAKGGFGVLGDAGYHNLDLLNWLFGPPAEVFSIQSGCNRRNPVHPYDTDDTAVALLHYAGGLIACVACSWVTTRLGEAELDVVVHGADATLAATPQAFEKFDHAGQLLDRRPAAHHPQKSGSQGPPDGCKDMIRRTVAAKIAAFVSAIRGPEANRRFCPCSARENLVNQAIVEAAYLSGRTGQRQSPARIFEVHQLAIEDFIIQPAAKADRRGP